jgi:hypothetical protein
MVWSPQRQQGKFGGAAIPLLALRASIDGILLHY